MGERFVELLLSGMKRCIAALSNYWKWRVTPPEPGQNRSVDQW